MLNKPTLEQFRLAGLGGQCHSSYQTLPSVLQVGLRAAAVYARVLDYGTIRKLAMFTNDYLRYSIDTLVES
jgi:hypothetical protein